MLNKVLFAADGEADSKQGQGRVEAKTAVGKNLAEDPAEAKPKKMSRPQSGAAINTGMLSGLFGLAATRLGYLWPQFDFCRPSHLIFCF